MTLDEFKERVAKDEEWAPGWDAIDAAFDGLYSGQEPKHFGTELHARAIFGGDQFLDGCSIYTSPKGFKHLVTYGMTNLYADEEAFGGEWNGWGYEMTMKAAAENIDDCMWCIDPLANLARYTYTTDRFFEPYQFVSNKGEPIKAGSDSAITAVLIVPDTEAQGVDTIYGRTDFLQLVGTTEKELQAIMKEPDKALLLAEKLREISPDLVTDMGRTKSVEF